MANQGIPTKEQLPQMVREHWREHRPAMFASLKKMGYLDEAIQIEVKGTLEAMAVLTGRGMEPRIAWMTVREEYVFPPAEEPEDEQ